MTLGTPAQVYLHSLQRTHDNETKQVLIGMLRQITGQDFGNDVSLWAEWIETYCDDLGNMGGEDEISVDSDDTKGQIAISEMVELEDIWI